MRLPDLFSQAASGGVEEQDKQSSMPFFDPKKYEHLVATAVLNKVNSRLFIRHIDGKWICQNRYLTSGIFVHRLISIIGALAFATDSPV